MSPRGWVARSALALCVLAACKSTPPDRPSVGSDTNWLRACVQDTDCGVSECRCGVCTLSCDALDACAAIPEAQLCIEVGDLSETDCRVGFADPMQQGICSRSCESNRDCGSEGGSAAYCVDGVCLPAGGSTPNGPVADLANGPKTDASTTAIDAASDGPPAGDSGLTDAGRNAGLDGSGLIGGPLVTIGDMEIEFPTPQPRCPCTSDLSPDTPAPAPGDVEANAYGNPSPPAEPSNSPLEGGAYYLQCSMPAPFWWFNAETECTRYQNCWVPCLSDADCPSGGSGSAKPRCGLTGACFLDCRDAQTCPDGMACVTGSDGAACFWPQDVAAPGCDGYCRQHPPPRDCDNWCAEPLVACNPDAGIHCCQGLACTDEGYCDELP